jgi:hypothetical protein
MAEMKALLEAANREVAHLKKYVKGLEEELRYLRGDTPTVVPKSAVSAEVGAVSAPTNTDTAVSGTLVAANLPDVERMHIEYTQMEEKLEEAEKEQTRLLDLQDRLVDQIQEREAADEERDRMFTELQSTHDRSMVRQDELQRQNKILIGKVGGGFLFFFSFFFFFFFFFPSVFLSFLLFSFLLSLFLSFFLVLAQKSVHMSYSMRSLFVNSRVWCMSTSTIVFVLLCLPSHPYHRSHR